MCCFHGTASAEQDSFSLPPLPAPSVFAPGCQFFPGAEQEVSLTSSFPPACQHDNIIPSKPKKEEHKNTGFIDFNFYPYTEVDADNSITVNALANLPMGFQYFSLTNYDRDPSRGELEEIDGILTEQNLRWKVPGNVPVSLAVQALIRTGGNGNDALRIGPRWSLHDMWGLKTICKPLGLKYWIATYGAQFDHFDGYQWQIEHCFRLNVLPDRFGNRVYIGGFADHNINHANGTDSTWLEEAQLGIRIWDEWYLVAEQRYNGFRTGQESSLGLGFEYVIRFK